MCVRPLSKGDILLLGKRTKSTNVVKTYVSGIFNEITRLITKYAAPIKIARAEVSPRHPPTLPKNISIYEGSVASAVPFKMARGVASDTISGEIKNPVSKGAVHFVIITGHDASKNARPTSAGFIKLCPVPPKNCFAIMIETKAPIRQIHHGAETGRLNASKSPVTAAVPSEIVTGFFVIFCHKNSNPTENKTQSAHKRADLAPKK